MIGSQTTARKGKEHGVHNVVSESASLVKVHTMYKRGPLFGPLFSSPEQLSLVCEARLLSTAEAVLENVSH